MTRPDAHIPGRDYADDDTKLLVNKAGAESVRIVQLPDTLKKGWDLADPIPQDLDVNDLLANAEHCFETGACMRA